MPQIIDMRGYIALLIALALWREAEGEGRDGLTGVACVMANRARRNGGDWFAVLTAPNQFSSMSVRGDARTVAWPSPKDGVFPTCIALANAALAGTLADTTGGATEYENPATATSAWFAQAIQSGKLTPTVTIGRHVFYKESAPHV